jgi:hypothetical protein
MSFNFRIYEIIRFFIQSQFLSYCRGSIGHANFEVSFGLKIQDFFKAASILFELRQN